MRACSLFTLQLFCITIISCSLKERKNTPCVHSLRFIVRAIRYDNPVFLMGFDKIAAIGPDFKWTCFQISDSIQNLDHLKTVDF